MSFGPSAQAVANVRGFWDAQAFLGAEKDSRKICGNNTYVERRNPHSIAIRLHQTDIITFSESGLVTLSTGGWHSQITKQRLEQFLPAPLTVFSFKGQWRLGLGSGQRWANTRAECANSIVLTDGLTLRRHADGTFEPLNALTPDAEDRLNAAKRDLDKAVKRYVEKLAEKVPEWSAQVREDKGLKVVGDPWCCTMGIGAGDNDHLWSHLREGYVFPTLVVNAFKDSGRWDGGRYTAAEYAVNNIAFGNTRTIVREVAKYLRKHLDPFASPDAAAADPKSNAALERYTEIAKEVLEKPSDFGYFGKDFNLWKFSAPTFTKHRDSENVEIANFEIVWETLKAEFPDLFHDGLDEEGYPDPDFASWPAIYVFGAGHWAVGHIDQIVVPVVADRERPVGPHNLHPAFIRVTELAEQTKLYPALPGAEERAERMTTEQTIKDIREWQEYRAKQGDPFITVFSAEELFSYLPDGEASYNWSCDDDPLIGVQTLHLLACWKDAFAQVDGQGVLI